MYLCPQCLLQGYCRSLKVRLVSDAQLANPEFIRDVRAHAYAMRMSCDRWASFLIDAYRDYPGQVVDAKGEEIELDTSVFDGKSMRYWFRDFACTPCPAHIVPRLRGEARERVRTMATILAAIDPVAATLWGVRPANDAERLLPTPAAVSQKVPGCPYNKPDRWKTLIHIRYDRLRKTKE